MPANKRFGSLLSSPPKPLPDDDETSSEQASEIEIVTDPEPAPQPAVAAATEAEAEVVMPDAAVDAVAVEPGPPVVVQPAQPTVQPEAAPAPAPVVVPAVAAAEPAGETVDETSAVPSFVRPERNVPLTLRLHMPAAKAFRDAWFDARRTLDPTLSSPEFASEILMLGLDAYEKRRPR